LIKKIHISVQSLVMYVNRTGDIESLFTGSLRKVEGARAHIKIQKSRSVEYRKEIKISHIEKTKYVELEIKGRIDGVFTYPEKTIVDEIKTTNRDPMQFEKNENPVHWTQIKVYSYLYALKHNLGKIFSQLTYFHRETSEVKERGQSFPNSGRCLNYQIRTIFYS